MKILIVEDEVIIAMDMDMILSSHGYEVIGPATDYDSAIKLLNSDLPDLVLLDIHLVGKKDGIAIAEKINLDYQIPFIFTTSFKDTATMDQAKAVKPAAYLIKPFKPEQILIAIELAIVNYAGEGEVEKPVADEGLIFNDSIFIKEKHRFTKITIADIKWLQASNNYVEIHLEGKKYLVRSSLKSFIAKLNHPDFFKVHKSYVVNINHIANIQPTSITINNQEIPLAPNYAATLLKRLKIF